MKKPTLKSYAIMAKVSIDCTITIDANSLEDALLRAKEFKEDSFVEVLGELNDASVEVHGIYKA